MYIRKMMRYNKQYKIWFEKLRKDYINEFFYGDEENWNSRSQPFMSFKHMLRKILHETGHDVAEIAKLEGINRNTVINSIETQNIVLHPVLKDNIYRFVMPRLTQDPVRKIRMSLLSDGGSNEQLSRRYGVHENVIDKIMTNQPVSDNTINYLYRQCTP